MASTENTEVVSDKEDGDEMASLQLIEKKDTLKSIDSEGSVKMNIINKDVLMEESKESKNDESSETISKNVEDMLLADAITQEPGDSDNQDDEMELRWDEDDLDDDEIENEETLLGEGPSDSPKAYPLSLQDEVIKTIEAEEKLLDLENDNESAKESPPDSISDNLFVPKMDHNLNKPDMMLEIPSHELIEFSDDEEDLTNNLEMSPDIETDEEMSILNDPTEATETDVQAEENLIEKELKETIPDENALENEAKLAADILTKELNAMDAEGSRTENTDIDKEISEEEVVLIKDDTTQEEITEEQIDKTDELLEIQNNDENIIVSEETPEDDIQFMEDEITDLCEEIIQSNSENQINLNSETHLEKTVSETEPPGVSSNVTSTDILDTEKLDSDATIDSMTLVSTETKASNIIETDSTPEPTITDTLESKVDQSTSPVTTLNQNEKNNTKISDETPKLVMEKKEDIVLNEPVTDPIIEETPINDPQPSTSAAFELEILQKSPIQKDARTEQDNSQDETANSTDTNNQLLTDIETEKAKNNPDIVQSIIIEPVPQSGKIDTNVLEVNSEVKDALPSTSAASLKEAEEINEHAPKIAKESVENETIVDLQLPAHTMDVDEPQPSTSFACPESSKAEQSSMFGSSMVQETSKDVPEMTDSLGLLAESSRVMEEDEEQEYDDDGEDEDDFDQDQDDESSNQMTAEHSEDSNAQHSESEVPKEIDAGTDKGFTFTITDVASEVNNAEAMECDEIEVTEKPQETNKTDNDLQIDSVKEEKQNEAMDIETVKLSDTSDTEVDTETGEKTILKSIVSKDNDKQTSEKIEKLSPCKTVNLEIVKQENVLSFVDLEESSSEDDTQETKKEPQTVTEPEPVVNTADESNDVTIDTNTDIKSTEPEVDSGSQKPSPSKSPAPNVSEDTKTSNDGESTLANKESKPKSSLGLEVFNLDSDEEEQTKTEEEKPVEDTKELVKNALKCINKLCSSDTGVQYYIADIETINFYDADKKKRGYVCQNCADGVEKRNQELINGIKNFTPLLELSISRSCEELVEISDSESEEEPELDQVQKQIIGAEGAKVAEEKLAKMINETWEKFKMDARLLDTQNTLQKEMEKLQKESAEIDELLNECQVATDQIRNELYATFEPDIRELPPYVIYDMPNCTYSCVEPTTNEYTPSKRGRSPSKEIPAKRPAIPLGYAPLDDKNNDETKNIRVTSEKAEDDNTDVSVVKLSAESAPKDLPPPGEITMNPVKVGMTVYAMKNAFGSWLKARVVEILPKPVNSTFTLCRVKFEHKVTKNPYKILPARCLAYYEPPDVRMTIGRRVIALFKDSSKREAYYSGIVAEIPNPVNSYRYLIFFDDGYAQYARHAQTRLVCECSCLVWEEVHPYSREFVRQYLFAYPERPMVRLHAGQNLKTEWRGKWWSSRVVRVDASLVEVQFVRRERREWIYRGSTRLAPLYLELQAAERHRPRAVPRAQPQARTNMPYVEYTRSDEQTSKLPESQQQQQQQQQQQNEEMRRQRAVAKKSTTQAPTQPASDNLDNVTSRVVYYTPKNAVKPYKMTSHSCSPKCKRTDVLALKDLRTYNPLAKPLLSGWERQIVRWKGLRAVLYVAPCGRRVRDVRELHAYLRAVRSDMPVDLFDFSPATHCLAEFVLNKCFVGKKDLSHGKENVPVPCVNYYDESLPEFCSYNTERTPTAGVPLNIDPDFLCGCDCEDDCEDKTKCACWKMTLEGARTIGLEGDNVGYVYKRLPEPLPSGIYECNSRCKCKHTCLNRVAQHPLQLKLQVFKTLNRGWGIRALNDVPKGAFLCVYAGNLLTDATANLDGLNEGDEYLAELDYIEVVEQMKEGYEEDIPEKIKKLDKKELEQQASEDTEEEELSSEDEGSNNKTDLEDDDFQPGHIGLGVAEFSKRLRRRDSKKQKEDDNQKEKEDDKKEEEKKESEKETNPDEECITISDDEEVREPSCFTAAAGMGANEFISKYRSVRTLFGEDEACYIMDAKVQGNIGRYLNHSCCPNVFVQNVFVDTHDPRFPWVAFFALSHIRAGTELTWNYNYDVGSVPGKVLYCHCGANNCRGRLL